MAQNLGNLFITYSGDDIIERNNTHTIINKGVTLSSSVSKFGDKSLFFDGSASLEFLDSEAWYIDSDHTIDLWVYPTLINNYTHSMVAQWKYGDGTNRSFDFRLQDNSNNLKCTIITQPNSTYFHNESDNAVPTNQWSHVAVVIHNGSSKLYVNGTLASEPLSITGTTNNSATNLTIGTILGASRYFYGYMDKVRVVKGTALWESNFNPNNDSEMFYATPKPVSSIYSVGHRGNLRGKAKNGFVRPTIKEFFTSTNYEGISLPYLFIGSSENKSMMSSSSNYDATYEAQEAFNGIINGSTDCWICKEDNKPDGTDRCWIAITFDTDTKVHSFRMARRADGTGTNFPKDLNVYMDDTLVGSFTNSDVARGDYAEWHELSNNYGTTLKIAITSKYDDYPVYKWVSIAELQFYLV